MSKALPIKLSGSLVKEARLSAKVFRRSLTGQIEHWATLGKVIESQLSGESVTRLLQQTGGTLKIASVDSANLRQTMAGVLAQFLRQSDGAADTSWLGELTARGIPLYGTTAADPEKIVERSGALVPADASR